MRCICARASVALVLVASLLTATARADRGRPVDEDEPAAAEIEPPRVATGSLPYGSSHWRPEWRRFHWVQGVATGVVAAGGIGLFLWGDQGQGGWGPVFPGEIEVRDALRIRDPDDRERVAMISDYLFIGLMAVPIVLDAIVLAGLVHGDWDAALQLSLIDLQSLALGLLASMMSQRLSGRERPFVHDCVDRDAPGCNGENGEFTSFVGGHAMMAFDGAALVCLHQLENPWILGSRVAAGVACTIAVTSATAVSFMRLSADRHWLSDIFVGAALGAAFGGLVPFLTHYAPGVSFAPQVGSTGSGLTVAGTF